ncbi:MAG: hypothetical protein IBJ18_00910 [Phycisphaerales bacterium]|nr:hypothetical protein [Phycisphaerales bacterium]
MPVHDWQFWVTTLVALMALGYLLRNVVPVPFWTKRAKRKKHERRATLTVSAAPAGSQDKKSE